MKGKWVWQANCCDQSCELWLTGLVLQSKQDFELDKKGTKLKVVKKKIKYFLRHMVKTHLRSDWKHLPVCWLVSTKKLSGSSYLTVKVARDKDSIPTYSSTDVTVDIPAGMSDPITKPIWLHVMSYICYIDMQDPFCFWVHCATAPRMMCSRITHNHELSL